MKEVQRLLKLVSDGLKTLAQGVDALVEKVDDTAKNKNTGITESKKQPAPAKPAKPVSEKTKPVQKTATKAAPKKSVKPATAIDTVLNIISRSSKGASTTAIKAETGYDLKKISNIIYKLKKRGKIKSIQKGVYVKAS